MRIADELVKSSLLPANSFYNQKAKTGFKGYVDKRAGPACSGLDKNSPPFWPVDWRVRVQNPRLM